MGKEELTKVGSAREEVRGLRPLVRTVDVYVVGSSGGHTNCGSSSVGPGAAARAVWE